MQLTVILGATVTMQIDGHSATNGAPFPDGSTLALVSNDPTVATVPADAGTLSSGQATASVPVTVLASGSTDLTATLTAPDGSTFTDTATLIVAPAVAGLTHITVTLTSP
jgi:hypothetical protein